MPGVKREDVIVLVAVVITIVVVLAIVLLVSGGHVFGALAV